MSSVLPIQPDEGPPTEAVAVSDAVEEREKELARERQREHGGTAPGRPKNTSGNFPQVSERAPQVRDRIGAMVGMSGRTYGASDDLHDYEEDLDELPKEPGLCPGCARAPQEWATGLCISCVSVRYQRRADYDEPKEQREASANA